MTGELLPWALEGLDLGAEVLEIGPGYGIATAVLGARDGRVACVELDGALARGLSRRFGGTNVGVVQADAVHLPFGDASFSAAVCFTMLHHVEGGSRQDRMFAEVARVLCPGGTFAGTDSAGGVLFRMIHLGDTLTPIEPRRLPRRLQGAGFEGIRVDQRLGVFRFRARRAGGPA